MKKFFKNFAQLFGANQISSLGIFVERFLQSFLPAGGISILSYSSQITTNVCGLLTFRDIFIVPLSSKNNRNEKLERIVIGLAMIAAPAMAFFYFFSNDIVSILFLRGKFDSQAAALLSSALSVYALALLPGIIAAPAFRMFQVIDRIKNTGFIYLCNTIGFFLSGIFLIFYLKMGILGFAYAILINSCQSVILTFYLLYRNGVIVDYGRIAKFAAYAVMACFTAGYLSNLLSFSSISNISIMCVKSFAYLLLISLAFLPLRKRLMAVAGHPGN